MTPLFDMREKLEELILLEKFADHVWLDRGLNPSIKSLCISLQNELNLIIREILKLPVDSTDLNKISVLKKSLLSFDKYELDTEEKELIADYFAQISDIIKIDINEIIDVWLYGFSTKFVFKKATDIKKSIFSECSNCKTSLKIDILSERNNVPAFWEIAQCNICDGFNLIDVPPNVDKFRNGNFFVFEIFKKNEHTLEEAIEKMNYYKQVNSD